MELPEHALQLIASIRDEMKRVEINVSQCSRLADRIDAIVQALKVHTKTIHVGEDVDKLHVECLSILLKRAWLVVVECGGSKWVDKCLIRDDNKEAFEEVHEELTSYLFKITGCRDEGTTDLNTATLPPTTKLLSEDAERDLQDMQARLKDELRVIEKEPTSEKLAESLRKIIKVISDKYKLETTGDEASNLQIPLSEIIRKNLIGTGSYGNVYEAEWLGCRVCLKDFPWSGGYSQQWLDQAKPLLKLRHSNVLQLVGFSPSLVECEESKVLTEIMEGDMRSLIDRRMKEQDGKGTPFHLCVAVDIMIQVARGLRCLHQNGFMHADRVLTTNIIIKEYDGYVDARIGDFGVPVDCPVEYIHDCEPRLDDPNGVETARWMAPEVCDPARRGAVRFSTSSDIYSFGMVCYEVLTGKIPFYHYTDVGPMEFSHIMSGERPELPHDLDERVALLIRGCWDMDPSSRPTALEIVNRLEKIQFSAAPTDSHSTLLEGVRK